PRLRPRAGRDRPLSTALSRRLHRPDHPAVLREHLRSPAARAEGCRGRRCPGEARPGVPRNRDQGAASVTLHSRRGFVRDTTAGLLEGWAAGPLSGQERGTVPGVRERIRQDVAAAPLSMLFKGTTAAECRKWQATFKKQLLELLGPHSPPAKWKTVNKGAVD